MCVCGGGGEGVRACVHVCVGKGVGGGGKRRVARGCWPNYQGQSFLRGLLFIH